MLAVDVGVHHTEEVLEFVGVGQIKMVVEPDDIPADLVAWSREAA